MMKLSPTGGGSAMQGLEIFESVGSVPEPGEQKPLESTSQVEPRAEGEQVVTKRFRGLERQSGIQGIVWRKDLAGWRVQWWEGKTRKACNFSISNHMKPGLREGDASEAALEQAKAFREELVRLGKLKPPTPITENAFGSTVKGVFYNKQTKTWRVQAEARARELAKEFGRQEEVVPVKPLSELPHFEPLRPEKGIKWSQQSWHAQITVAGEHRGRRFRPQDLSAKEVQKAWKQAVAWRTQNEKEMRAKQSRKWKQ
eukprot:s3112_g4.t2